MSTSQAIAPPREPRDRSASRSSALHPLFAVAMVELFVGGGGRLIEFGSATLRMFLFVACAGALLWAALWMRDRRPAVVLAWAAAGIYLSLHGLAFALGAAVGNDAEVMLTDLQQTAHWLLAPFFAVCLAARRQVGQLARLVEACAAALAISYLALLTALWLGLLDPGAVFEAINQSPEFVLRGDGFFFFKGFLYLGIGVVFFIALSRRFAGALAALCAVALLFALTRGFIIATSVAVLALLIDQRRWRALAMSGIAVAATVVFMFIYLPASDDAIVNQRELSNEERIADFAYVYKNTTIRTLLVGEGAGTPVGDRMAVENTFMWAFWRMGLPGLAFWSMPLVLCTFFYFRVRRSHPDRALAAAFFYSTLLIYVQTMTNPYLNNPIGLSFVLASIFSLATLGRPLEGLRR